MKVVLSIPGHLKTVPMNRYIYQTLVDMGVEVRLFNFGVSGIFPKMLKKISEKSFFTMMNTQLKNLVDNFKPDVFLTIFGFDHDKAVIDYMKDQGIVTCCWWLNDPFQIKRSLAQASNYDYYVTNARGTLKDYQANGISNALFLPLGACPLVHRKLPDEGKPYDICFAGDWGPMREKMLLSLAGDFRVSIWGPWKKKLTKDSPLNRCLVKDGFFTPEEMARIFNRSKIVLNIHSWFGSWNCGVNPRLFEANGCGAFQLSDYKKEIPELYEPDQEIVLYHNLDELKQKATFYLAADKRRSEIAEQGFKRTAREHTYAHRLAEMFNNFNPK
jgi:spore maturation protein CgeB